MKHKFPGTIFSLSVLGEFFDDNNILIDAVLNLSTFQSICKSYFPTTQITFGYGFKYIKPEVSVPSFC